MAAIIEVLIGMVFVYSLLSILVTQINTVISNVLRLRAKHLREGIAELITDPVMRAKVLSHPLINMVEGNMVLPDQKISQDDAEKIANSKVKDVTWIPPKTFVNVLLSIVKVDSDRELFGVLLNSIDAMPSGPERRTLRLLVNRLVSTGDGLEELHHAVNTLEDEAYRDALNEALDDIDEELGKLGLEPDSIITIMAGLRKIKNPYFRSAMETILSTSKTLIEAEEKLEQWFDDGMGRATETFKQKMQYISLIVGIVLALIVNVDSLHLARTFWEDPVLREGVAAAARQAELEVMNEAASVDASTQDATTEEIVADISESTQAARQTLDEILDLRLPIGWSFDDLNAVGVVDGDPLRQNPSNLWNYSPVNNPGGWLQLLVVKAIGCIATMIAIAQGAPFWFNILNRLTGK